MNQLNFAQKSTFGTPPQLIPLLHKTKDLYLLWYQYYQLLPKAHKFTLGQKVDNLLVATIEAIAIAGFLPPAEKPPYIKVAIRKTDTLKIFLMILWESKSLDDKKYIALSEKVSEIGKMLGGWNGQILAKIEKDHTKQNSSGNKQEEK